MTINRRALGGAIATLLLVAACGSSASPASTTVPSAAATTAPESAAPTEAPTETPAAVETPGSSFVPSFAPGSAADLEALLPSEVNGVTFTKTSFTGESIPAGSPVGDTELEALLQQTGKSLRDVRVAMATASGSANVGNLVMAIQIKGIDPAKFKDWAVKSIESGSATPTTIAGKQVYGTEQGGFGAYLYPKGDTIYYVVSVGTEGMAQGILSALP